ncbi:DUF559 domain-containing protein [Caulobacter sp. 602-2]|uniref:DUF559 domain-containing protein n=1 Tax=Caulobacter sp. 602-2 TaxID=2710887 RepID=A0A6G4QYS8_9CAUL|nr:endonuclease domain-containing protein [Caulobacter sp. 602-2]NGM50780.1 DUF559 domain-containing protein [Caulobacter sp. 602-2]
MNRTAMARRLRRDQTDAERLLWSALRGRRLEGFKFRRQVPIDRYVADFACLDARLVVELDGGQHAEDVGRAYDAARTEVLEACGFFVLRFWNDAVRYELDGVVDEIASVLRAARP